MEDASIDIETLPELETGVGVFGSTEQAEVGGDVCSTIAMTIYLYSHD